MFKVGTLKINRVLSVVTIATLLFMILLGLISCIYEIRPFWFDEWSVIYNLKFKASNELWGKMDYKQQFPRVYLQVIKFFTSRYNYSYTSLRLPSYIVHCTGLVFCFFMGRKIWGKKPALGMLWFLIYAGFTASVFYFVQIKQYTMEMLLSLVSIWQMIQLYNIQEGKKEKAGRLVFLTIITIAAPFFSYTYPITLAPLYLVLIIQYLNLRKNKEKVFVSWTITLLILSSVSVILFYLIDVKQVMEDQYMKEFWVDHLMSNGFSFRRFLMNCYMLFGGLGPYRFHALFFVIGFPAFIYSIIKLLKQKMQLRSVKDALMAYSILLVLICLVLNIAQKLPIGNDRLNAFMVPSMATIMICFLEEAISLKNVRAAGMAKFLVYFLIISTAIKIYLPMIKDLVGEDPDKKLAIYRLVERKIKLAAATNHLLCADSSVAYPFNHATTGDWVVKVQPAYNVALQIPVYQLQNNDTVSRGDTVKISAKSIINQ